MILNISGSGRTQPLVGQRIENASENTEKLEQAVSLQQLMQVMQQLAGGTQNNGG